MTLFCSRFMLLMLITELLIRLMDVPVQKDTVHRKLLPVEKTDVFAYGIQDKKMFQSQRLNQKQNKKKIQETVGQLRLEILIIVKVMVFNH